MARMKGADLITEYLIDNKIPYVFGICGHGNVGMLDSLYADRATASSSSRRATSRWRHTWRTPISACATSRWRRSPPAAPAPATSSCRCRWRCRDSSALLAITANVPTQQFNRSPFQEINKHFQADFPSIIRPVVKRCFQPTRVDMLPLALRQAMTTMLSGRPGPVNVDVPFNVFQEEDDVEIPRSRRRSTPGAAALRPMRSPRAWI